MSALDEDCLAVVFDLLSYESHTLYCCIQVNRLWFRLAAPFLWKRPMASFNSFSFSHESGYLKTSSLIETFFTSLIYNAQQLDTSFSGTRVARPLCNYVSFIRELDIDLIRLAIIGWLCHTYTDSERRRKMVSILLGRFISQINSIFMPNILDEIYVRTGKMLMTQCTKMWYLSLNSFSETKESFIDPYPPSSYKIVGYPGADKCLSHLVGLSCKANEQLITMLNGISVIANNIRILKIDWSRGTKPSGFYQESSEAKAMTDFIKSQSSLCDIELYKFHIDSPFLMNRLTTIANSLTKLTFRKVTIGEFQCFSPISQLVNLRELAFIDCEFWNDGSSLNLLKFPYLHSLELNSSYPLQVFLPSSESNISSSWPVADLDDVDSRDLSSSDDSLKENSNTPLRHFTFIHIPATEHKLILRYIACNFNNVTHFTCNEFIHDFRPFNQFFAFCKFLKKIIIKNKVFRTGGEAADTVTETVIDDFFLQVKHPHWKDLYHLELHGYFYFSVESLETFFKNSKFRLLNFVIKRSLCFGNQHLKVLLDHQGEHLKKVRLSGNKKLYKNLRNKAISEYEIDLDYKFFTNKDI
ncbi:164_t:CDS:1 [Acaulospora morrowiae]|uniref:164_t:CDS:1 n=1 Tax=Acaulospora morrowiae TaxID=94023 RepID=A0A9N9D167_9GLOM|nr:164_t:CDS:1 [Acaulospora morrowiae]